MNSKKGRAVLIIAALLLAVFSIGTISAKMGAPAAKADSFAARLRNSFRKDPADVRRGKTDSQGTYRYESPQLDNALGMGTVGEVQAGAVGIDPMRYLTSWNFNNLPPGERSRYYRESPLEGGRVLREYWIYAVDREIEVAPGVYFQAWTFNGQVPGPTIRATEGDRIRIHFYNSGTKPHTMHFHGFHPEGADGSLPSQFVLPGDSFVYEFDAEPFGIHLYHCHSTPLTQHIHKGLYGAYIVDPPKPRKEALELVMVMNGFDTNFDEENEVYAVNSVAFYYMNNPIEVEEGKLVRIYLVNILEFDQINSFHLHANFFHEFRTGTALVPTSYTDIIVLGQAERSILELRFRYPGDFMFHAHKTEFTERGWTGLFRVKAGKGE